MSLALQKGWIAMLGYTDFPSIALLGLRIHAIYLLYLMDFERFVTASYLYKIEVPLSPFHLKL